MTAVQTQVVPPVTSAFILDHPTITLGPQTICWVKGEEGPEGEEEERGGEEGWCGVKSDFEVCNSLIETIFSHSPFG